jgi:hypothetical protein
MALRADADPLEIKPPTDVKVVPGSSTICEVAPASRIDVTAY